ncbi:GNAT family N-acetyltransferase [Cohnella nanjingensis]|uniref:GNAT family N-acetyltransferase n=1 Tax=Cohnella nanjingensis TaxID=1387779 RepID=A0A7X0RSJ7_9BACL|nr:GNAT family N-acetyltransferase [Cohnella nanjingensis]MBB6672756.1 GNAT family N-acetyltransferase [Cohnella nanjingensis]
MRFETYDRLEERIWPEARRLYHQAFPEGRKPDGIIEAMFARKLSLLHIGETDGLVAAMAITGVIRPANALLIDYLAVRPDRQGEGLGTAFVEAMKTWAKDEQGLDGLILEAESDPTPANERRIRFWRRCGFIATAYVHQYIWVPEPYRAMYLPFGEAPNLPRDGEALFRHIGAFHRRSFRKP